MKEVLTLNKPAYVGMCILDLSRTLMYYFNYDYIKYNNGHKAKLLFTNTKSLVYGIETCDLYEDFYKSKIILV